MVKNYTICFIFYLFFLHYRTYWRIQTGATIENISGNSSQCNGEKYFENIDTIQYVKCYNQSENKMLWIREFGRINLT